MRRAYLLILPLILWLACGASARQEPSTTGGEQTAGSRERRGEDQDAIRQDMLKDLAIKREESDYKQNLERAKEAAQLGAELHEAFSHNKSLGPEDFKKLSRMEKLSRQIRHEAGGSDGDEELKEPPRSLGDALSSLAARSEDLHKDVEKTPRHVVSAAVIECANQLIELIRLTRTLTP